MSYSSLWPSIYYDRQGSPISIEEAERLLQDRDYMVVAVHEEGGYKVSTVWLGLDIGRIMDREGRLFESMIFGPDASDRAWKYPDEAAALAGHERLTAKLREYLDDPTKGLP